MLNGQKSEEDLTVKHNRVERRKSAREKPIRTTFMELIQEVSSLTSDDFLVVAAVKRIFDTYKAVAVVAPRSIGPRRNPAQSTPQIRLE
jgi:hypothetical protein